MPKKKEQLSGAIQLLSATWRHSEKTCKHSWRTLNDAMHTALHLALTSGMEFYEDDFAYMSKEFRLGYWCGDLEMFYKAAVEVRNASAWKAFEHHRGRVPYIFPQALYGTKIVPVRLVVGAKFRWRDHDVTVTSFKDAGPYLNACSHIRTEREDCPTCHGCKTYPTQKVQHVFQIDHQDLKDERNRLKRLAAAAAQLQEKAAA
jgi:hypothetical protein